MTLTARAMLATVRDNPGDKIARMVYADALQDAGDEEGAAIQRAIAEPDNDGHRLALADALERTAATVKCKACKGEGKIGVGNNGNPYMATCDECHGTGRVSDGRKEWSEFIRVQCELDRDFFARNRSINEKFHSLRTRERELWPAVRRRFEGEGLPSGKFIISEDQ